MKKTRIRILEKAISREEAENLVGDIACSANNRRRIVTEMDAKLLAIREEYAGSLELYDEDIKSKSLLVQAWAESNPEEFTRRKSVVFPSGTVGFRTGTPKLKCLSGWTFAKVLAALKSLEWGFAFLRIVEEVAKDELIAAFGQSRIADTELRQIGVKVVQDEAFFVEPDLSQFETRIEKAA